MSRRRIVVLMILFLALFTILGGRMAYCQLIQGPELAARAAAMRSQRVELKEYSRGDILDRNQLPLTNSASSMSLYCLPQNLNTNSAERTREATEVTLQDVTHHLGPILGREPERLYQQLVASMEKNSGWVRLADGLSSEQQASISALKQPSLVMVPITKRYQDNGFCAHLLGYIDGGAAPRGVAGVEKAYNQLLSGASSASQLVSVQDARGAAIDGLMYKIRQEQDQQKSAVVLTIDRRVQEMAEQALDRWVKRGAVVIMDVHSKEVLAMVSRPSFNPYAVGESRGTDSPLINRALTKYYPGSMFKILVAAAALEEGVVKPDENFFCSGKYIMPDGFSFSCERKTGHGKLTFAQAFALSCNPTFIDVGTRLKTSGLMAYVKKMHIDEEGLIGYPIVSGTGIRINPGPRALANACLGQDGVMLSPLQVCSLISTVADQGRWATPRVLSYTIDANGQQQTPPAAQEEQVLSQQTVGILQRLMEKVVKEGTGTTASFPEAPAAGKTGTSQTGMLKDQDQEVLNTWFGGYFPADHPRWAMVILVEDGKSGARDAAPVFKDIAQNMVNTLGSRVD
ncbi:MAG TPA: penicillin-binding protein 2 [Syntrophomonadaceae bacterium]|nr:penicillin-binding protein 2 [Syntrophomonadaceae bacterium]